MVGRPPKPKERRKKLGVRLSDGERTFIEHAASKAEEPLAAFIRRAALERATKITQEKRHAEEEDSNEDREEGEAEEEGVA